MKFELVYVGVSHKLDDLSVSQLQSTQLTQTPRVRAVLLGDTPRQEGQSLVAPLVGTQPGVDVIMIAAPDNKFTGSEPIADIYNLAAEGSLPFVAEKSTLGNFKLTTPPLEKGSYHLWIATYAEA